jgi:hypothetical protein
VQAAKGAFGAGVSVAAIDSNSNIKERNQKMENKSLFQFLLQNSVHGIRQSPCVSHV